MKKNMSFIGYIKIGLLTMMIFSLLILVFVALGLLVHAFYHRPLIMAAIAGTVIVVFGVINYIVSPKDNEE